MVVKNITDLIEQLQKIKKEHGDIKVAVQYRDEGGYYHGFDVELDLSVEECKSDVFGNGFIKKGEKYLSL